MSLLPTLAGSTVSRVTESRGWRRSCFSILLLSACAAPGAGARASGEVPYFSAPVVLVISPDAEERASLEQRLGEDFYVVADDAMWYRANAYQLLDSLGIPTVEARRGEAEFQVEGSRRLFRWSDFEGRWFLVLYDGVNEPRITYDVDLHAHLAYFGRVLE
jgi:hypothetical protein